MTHRILILGGLGYVGGRVAKYVLENRLAEVVIGTRQKSIDRPTWLPQVSLTTIDWDNRTSIAAALSGVDTVIHLAAMNENESASDPEGAIKSTGLTTLRLIEGMKSKSVRRLIYLSTAHVYGRALVGLVDESTVPRATNAYGYGHRLAEDIVLAEKDAGRIEGVVLRLSNGFGAPVDALVDRWTLVVNDLCRQAVTTRTLVLRSAGLQRRDFITLHNVSRAITHTALLSTSALGDGLFNLGGGCSWQIIEVVKRVAARCEAVLGFIPQIHCPAPGPFDLELPLDYRSDKFTATGFHFEGDPNTEIDATLKLCASAFGEQGSIR